MDGDLFLQGPFYFRDELNTILYLLAFTTVLLPDFLFYGAVKITRFFYRDFTVVQNRAYFYLSPGFS